MSIDKPSVVKDCVVTTVTCGLAVGAVSAVVGAIAVYLQDLLALAVTFGAYVATVFEPVALWLSQDLPPAVTWIAWAAFLWSFCLSHNLKRKGVTGRYATVVSRTNGILICGFGLYWLVQLFIQIDVVGRLVVVGTLLMIAFVFYLLGCLLRKEEEEEEERLKNQALEQSEQDVVQVQGVHQ